jgi:hypothetical protein
MNESSINDRPWGVIALAASVIIESASCMGASDNRGDLFGDSVEAFRRLQRQHNPDSAFTKLTDQYRLTDDVKRPE